MTDPMFVLDETPGDWHRDSHTVLRCLCGHLQPEHRQDGTRKTDPCAVGGCGCRCLRPSHVVFYEHRTVLGRLSSNEEEQ